MEGDVHGVIICRILARRRDLGIDLYLWGVLPPEPFTAVAVVGDLLRSGGADRTWVVDLADGSVLGSLPPVSAASCSAAGAYLACSTAGRVMAVWQVTRR